MRPSIIELVKTFTKYCLVYSLNDIVNNKCL